MGMTIHEIAEASPAELAALPPEELMRLQTEADAHAKAATRITSALHAVLATRYASGLNATGTHHREDGTVAVTVTVPKKIKWNQEKLNAASETLISWGEDPTNYVEFEIKVSERKYDAWPPAVRDVFTPARTVEPGKPVIKLEPQKVDA